MASSFNVETPATSGCALWCAIWTHAHCEQLVHDHLAAKRFDVFLPMIAAWSRRGGVQHLIQLPMFPGYLFLRSVADKASYIEVLKTRGVTRILGERWDRPAVIADEEIETVQRLVAAKVPVLAHPYLQEGHRVRITDGPLTDVEGILVQAKPQKGLLVVSVNLLRRSVAVEINCTAVVPTGHPVAAGAMADAAC
jgi:transcription termination/antitermination protein NusG